MAYAITNDTWDSQPGPGTGICRICSSILHKPILRPQLRRMSQSADNSCCTLVGNIGHLFKNQSVSKSVLCIKCCSPGLDSCRRHLALLFFECADFFSMRSVFAQVYYYETISENDMMLHLVLASITYIFICPAVPRKYPASRLQRQQ